MTEQETGGMDHFKVAEQDPSARCLLPEPSGNILLVDVKKRDGLT